MSIEKLAIVISQSKLPELAKKVLLVFLGYGDLGPMLGMVLPILGMGPIEPVTQEQLDASVSMARQVIHEIRTGDDARARQVLINLGVPAPLAALLFDNGNPTNPTS